MTTFFPRDADLHLPDSDGKPMADNTEQFRWIVLIKENLEILFADDPKVFVAGDLLWYLVKSRLKFSPRVPSMSNSKNIESPSRKELALFAWGKLQIKKT